MRDSMTDTFYPPPAITSHDLAPPSRPNNTHTYPENHRNGVSPMDDTQEDDGQIACFCGFADDDGNTVACDNCNRWQHTTCYYPQYDGRDLPDELQHYCIDCKPAPFDVEGARRRQQAKRDRQYSLSNGAKRQVNKSHKKKVKEPVATNGWPLDKSRHDRNSASPRDQPPPAKRPKTSHRSSESISKTHSRKRNASTVNARSLSQSPDQPPVEYYSPELIRAYADDEWVTANANLYNDISVTNSMSEWLRYPADAFQKKHGQGKGDLLMRWDGDLNDIPGKAQIDIMDSHNYQDNPEVPNLKFVTVKESVASGAYLGELKGHVGFTSQYKEDPSNRWALLRHAEPFVFFHPVLQIYIDARNEGTELRYVRRSCRPNARLQVLITDQTDYHFCFMATEQIDPGMEIAVAWDTQESIKDSINHINNGISPEDMDSLSDWVSNVLANCGPCACHSNECAMSRFDRRGMDDEPPPLKVPKNKRKKAGQHTSPLNTHALNSRSGSEARRGDAEDEPTDSRSVSGSGGGGSASRDITPNTHYSANGSLSNVPELSERERKKLAKEEEMFRRQEEERTTGRQNKKKRSSAGSNLNNTPGATKNSKYADAGTSRQSGLPGRPGRRPKNATKASANRVVTKVVPRPKTTYVDSETQCDLDQEDAERRAAERACAPPINFVSTRQRLLARCALNNKRRKVSFTPPKSVKSVDDENAMDVDTTNNAGSSPTSVKQDPALVDEKVAAAPVEQLDDTHMQDADDTSGPLDPPVDQAKNGEVEDEQQLSSPVASHPSSDPTAPPWPSKSSPRSEAADSTSAEGHRNPNLHVDMPPPAAGGVNWITSAAAHSSPLNLTAPPGPLFSPSVTAAVQPSPARKKLSLSDYTKRSKAKDKPDRDGSPASTASGPVAPPLQASSSEIQREGSQAVEDERDVKMEDAGDAPAPPTISTTQPTAVAGTTEAG